MEPRIHLVTLAVSDLDRAVAFYRDGLGFPTEGIVGTEFAGDETTPAGAVAMFRLGGGLMLALYPRSELAKDAGIAAGVAGAGGDFTLAHVVATRAEVDALLAEASRAGATLLGEAYERQWGVYSGYFRDPDGHLWEIAANPGLLEQVAG